jgi:hydrogenase maturation protease
VDRLDSRAWKLNVEVEASPRREERMKTRVICFGNTVLRDDGVGIHVAKALREVVEQRGLELDVVESAVAGYALIDLMQDWEQVILVEAVQLEDHEPGDVVRLDPLEEKLYLRLCSPREGNLPMLMEAGAKLGYAMPREVVFFGVQGEDLCTFGEDLTPKVEEAVPKVVEEVLGAAK